MVCYHPLHGWKSRQVNASGKRSITFDRRNSFSDLPVSVPCGQCIGCRLERSRQWAIRCVHEATLADENCFITLTYDEKNLPEEGTLVMKDFQDFMKRLREDIKPEKVRFFHCGEYGEQMRRPHYHACLFGINFSVDRKLWNIKNGNELYVSEKLNKLWGKGYCIIGDVTFDSAAYVARYVTKKITGEMKDSHYGGLKPEYTTMSRRPGIGYEWWKKYSKEVTKNDEVIVKGKAVKPPRYYDNLFDLKDKKGYDRIKALRKKAAEGRKEDNTDARLTVKEVCKKAQTRVLKRSYENVNGNIFGV